MQSPLLVIVGQTASGKSGLAIELAVRLNGEIICADSWTVRKGLDIGTAKPTLKEQQLVPHHLLNIVDPNEDFSAAVFKGLAETKIAEITSRGALPILVGGTGLYIDGLLYNYGFLPEGSDTERSELNNLKIDALLARIYQAGYDVEGIDTRNKRRLIRLLETGGKLPTKQVLRSNSLIIGLRLSADELQTRIVSRVDMMISSGLEQEVRELIEDFGWECEGLKGIGYREWQPYFEDQINISELRQSIIRSTRDLAKRQATWFKRNKSIHWFDIPLDMTLLVDLITTSLSK
jgi:tRNA dimethylallyltransferase